MRLTSLFPLFLFFIVLVFASFQDAALSGKEIFTKKCQRCHGEDGSKQKFGAKNLQISRMKFEDMVTLIASGKKPMPSFRNKLSADEIELVANYVISLRTYK